ncbi:unnamed protein product [Caenorhabditis sp. 36 PRJEB53466]|nr:unnamed protein product [Caenorhabditis sp. 36 PRJEB53466]
MASYSSQEVEAVLAPLFAKYIQAVDDEKWDVIEKFYHPNTVLVQKCKENTYFYGNKAATNFLRGFADITGKAVNSISNVKFEGTGNWLIISANFRTETEKIGVVTGKFLQIWKKEGEKLSVYHDEFEMDA